MFKLLSKLFRDQTLVPEQILAYRHKLPSKIGVSWERRNNFIVGEIFLNENPEERIYTQAKTADEFVKMVNDAVYVAYDLKSDYIEYFHANRECYKAPPKEEWDKLKDPEVASSKFGFELSSEKEFAIA